jgi:hypothetical protein
LPGLYGGETEDYPVTIIPPPIVIYYNPFADTLYDQVINVTARITQKDVGLNTTDFQPRLWAKKQSSPTWKSFPGQLISGTSKDGFWQFPVNHDSLNVRRNGCDSIQYYFVAQDINTPIYLSYLHEPAVHTNVKTQVSPPSSLFGYRLKPRLKDTVYVSASDCRYQSLSSNKGLFQEINFRKLEGNLTILIEGDLLEKGIHSVKNASLNGYRLTIRPSNNVIKSIKADFDNYTTILFDATKNVLIDGSYNGTGKYLKFTNNNSPYSADTLCNIKMTNSCDSIILQNLIFEDITDNQLANEFSIILSKGANKNIFTSNSAPKMTESFIASHYGSNNALIRGNEFNNFLESGIVISTACDNWIIDSNHFYRSIQATASSAKWAPINVKGGGHTITNNYIGGKAPFCGGGPLTFVDYASTDIVGIEATGPASTTPNIISNNRINNIDVSFTTPNSISESFTGIRTFDNNSIIKNNIIGNLQNSTKTISVLANNIYGISSGGTGQAEIRENIISGIKNNSTTVFTNTAFTGIHRSNSLNGSITYTDQAIISGNIISNILNTRNGASTVYSYGGLTLGLLIRGGSFNLIEKNSIYDLSVTENDISGIAFQDGLGAIPSIIQQNKIYNLINTSTTFSTCCNDDQTNGAINGIVVSAESSGLDIINNQVSITNNNIASPVTIRGVYEAGYINFPSNNFNLRVLYNSVYIGGSSTQNGGSGCYVFLHQRVKDIYNNIFFNERVGGTRGHFGIRMISSSSPATLVIKKSNHNFYVVTDSLAFAHYGTTPRISWTQWKTNTSFEDTSYIALAESIPSSSFFMNKVAGNLNINYDNVLSWNVNNKAKPYSSITADYDSMNVRSASIATGYTDIGSDEFSTNIMPPDGVCSGSNKSFTSNLNGTSYQWQIKTTAGFVNIDNSANYSGINTITLQLVAVPYSWNNQQYRCVVNGNTYSTTFTLTVAQTISPSVTISTASTTICAGANSTFLAVPLSVGNSPTYQWLKNGINTGTNGNNYVAIGLLNGDIISLKLTSGAACVNAAAVISNSIVMTVTPAISSTVNISSPSLIVCSGASVIFTATPTNGGTNPSYQWQVNSINTGANSDTFVTSSLTNASQVKVILTSNIGCATTTTVTSNIITLTVGNNIATGIVITGNTTVSAGQNSLLTSALVNGGATPLYQWQDSTATHSWQNVVTATTATLSYTPVETGNKIRCLLTSDASCVNPGIISSNVLVFDVTGGRNSVETIRYYPNPVTSILIIDSLKLSDSWRTLEIRSLDGKNMINLRSITNLTRAEVNMERFPPGQYVAVLKRENGTSAFLKFIKL